MGILFVYVPIDLKEECGVSQSKEKGEHATRMFVRFTCGTEGLIKVLSNQGTWSLSSYIGCGLQGSTKWQGKPFIIMFLARGREI